jgi:NAD(P)-dependent dehydrogenase (short-subunit alcohol dehydrogenase family)
MSRIALITGTSTGIGLSAAIALSRAGFSVIATMRNPGKADALRDRARAEGVAVDVRELDVQDDASVERCVRGVLEEHGRIDVLVNNAGAGHFGTTEMVSLDELRRTMDVNFYGVFRVTRAVLPSMRAARSGRIVSVTSVGGLIGQPFNDGYCAAKFAVEGMMESLAPVMKRLGVHVSLIEPGPVLTEFVASTRKRADVGPAVPDEAYRPLVEAYLAGTQQAFATVGQTGDDVAKVIVEAATAEAPQLRYPTSEVVRGLVGRKYVDATGASALALSGGRLS